MRWLIAGGAVMIAALLVAAYLGGGDQALLRWAAEGQRTAQTAMAQGLRALRGGTPPR